MKNTYITIAVVLVILVAIFAVLKSKKLEAPDTTGGMASIKEIDSTNEVTSTTETTMVTGVSSAVSATVGTSSVKEFTVYGKNFAFDPSEIKVKKGDRVKITFVNSEGMHNFIIDEFSLTSKTTKSPTTEILEFTADKVGSFEYYCSVSAHRVMGMKGKFIVSS